MKVKDWKNPTTKEVNNFLANTWIRTDFAKIVKTSTQRTLFMMIQAILPKLSENTFTKVLDLVTERLDQELKELNQGNK